ncbi:MAG: metal ABC transporter permease [Athalassotoga sp.]|uniref:metal ABC transporter permease n=1 Tax=Athalassotoga sp. TaxID=2022597 RepID=UPI003CFBCF60
MFDFFGLFFIQRAFIIGSIIAVVGGLIGPFVFYRKMAFMGVGIAHGTFAGIALGILIGVSPLPVAIIFAIGLGIFIGFISKTGKISEDVSIGILFSFAMGLGIFLISISPGYHTDIMGYLFGDILAISNYDMYLAIIVLILVFLWYMIRSRQMKYMTFDEDFAKISGVPVGIDYYIFMALISLVIVIIVNFVGVILASSIIIAPAAASKLVVKRFSAMVILSMIFGEIAIFSGITFSYYLNISSGPSIVFFITFVFILSLIFNKIKRAFNKKRAYDLKNNTWQRNV